MNAECKMMNEKRRIQFAVHHSSFIIHRLSLLTTDY